MKEFKGTPGPWVSCGSIYQDYGYHVKTADKYTICMGINEASNANLIAAAPELLQALQEMVAIVKKNTYPQPDKPLSMWGRMEAAEETIAKALGE